MSGLEGEEEGTAARLAPVRPSVRPSLPGWVKLRRALPVLLGFPTLLVEGMAEKRSRESNSEHITAVSQQTVTPSLRTTRRNGVTQVLSPRRRRSQQTVTLSLRTYHLKALGHSRSFCYIKERLMPTMQSYIPAYKPPFKFSAA